MTSSRWTASAKPIQLTDIRCSSPGSSDPPTRTSLSPGLSSARSFLIAPIRTFGPGRSCRIATCRPARPAALRMRSAFSAWISRFPCEKFRRATSSPACTIRASVSGSREAGPIVATILVRRMRTGNLANELAVVVKHLSIYAESAAVAQVADQIPVDRGFVLPAGLGIRAAEREMDGAGHLLVEQDRPGGTIDPGIGADSELSEQPRAGVARERRVEVVLASVGRGRNDLPGAERQLHAGDLD